MYNYHTTITKRSEPKMNTITINSFTEYIAFVEKNYSRNHIFRGIHNLSHKLIPKIGRQAYTNRCAADPAKLQDFLQDLEEHAISDFVKMSIPYQDLRSISAWDQWTIGQHHGLPTRFLDWTENPLIAAYFATENAKSDVAVYVVNKQQFNSQTEDLQDVFSFPDEDQILLYVPSYIHPRIIAQKGVFTVHRNPTIPLDEIEIDGTACIVDQLIIPKGTIQEFVEDLDWCGINRSFIYPGLDGLATYLDLQAKGGT